MIRINLLPVKTSKKRETGQQQLLAFLLALILAGGGLFLWYQSVEGDIEGLTGRVNAARKELNDLKKKTGDLSKYEQREKELKERLSQIETLQASKLGPVRMLAELSRRIPGRVWLTSVEEKEHKMTIKGAGLSYDDVSEFQRALRESGYFTNVKPTQQEEQASPIPGVPFVVFTLLADTKYAI